MNIGLLYSKDDAFALKRSELLVGSAILEKSRLLRFTNKDIQKKTLHVDAKEFINAEWQNVKNIDLDVILDYSIPKSPRKKEEKNLLSKIPHIARVDLDRYEILKLLLDDFTFKNELIAIEELNTFDDILKAQKNWNRVVVKPRVANNDATILILSKEDNGWLINEPYKRYHLDENALREFIDTNFLKGYFLQEYIHSVTKDEMAISFSVVTQQRYDGAWHTPFLRGVLSTDSIIASFKAGAELIPSPLFHDEALFFNFPSKSRAGKYTNQKILTLAIAISQKLSEILDKNLGAFGIRFVIDSNFEVKILSIDTRATSQGAPGKYLEFYKNIIEFAKYLPKEKNILNDSKRHTLVSHAPLKIPRKGITLHVNATADILKNYQWVDLSIGQGGRKSIVELSNAKVLNEDSSDIFFSFKVGRALNDRVNDHRVSILALEDYVGKGIIRWSECEFMRSIRTPLLKKQLEEVKELFNAIVPELIWLEDADLGIRPIIDKKDELSNSAKWFEDICKNGEAKSWGITLFSPKTKFSLEVLEILKELKPTCNNLKFLGINVKEVDISLIYKILDIGLHVVLISDTVSLKEFNKYNLNGVSLLEVYKGA